MTSPNDVPMPNNRPANDDQPTTPIAPVPPATMQIPHNTESTNFIERRYTLSVQQLFQTIHDQLTTGATFTLDEEDARTGMVRFHAFDGAQCTVTVTAEGALGSVIRLSATNDDSNKRAKEFFVMLDRRLGVTQTIDPAGGDASIYAPIPPKKPTSKLAVWGIIIGALFAFLAFTSDSGPSWFLGFIAALLSGMSLYATRTNGPKQGRILSYVGLGLIVVGLVVGGIKTIVSDMHDKADQMPECTSYTWTDSELAKMLPEPQSKQGEVTLDSSEQFNIEICNTSVEQFNTYVADVKAAGFDIDYSKSDDSFRANNKEGYSVSIDYEFLDSNDVMEINISAPQKNTDTSTTDEDTSDSDTTKSDEPSDTEGATSLSDGKKSGSSSGSKQPAQTEQPSATANDDFKATMDSYEAFFDEWIEFMTTYNAEGKPLSMLADYTQMMAQYTETMSKMDDIDETTLTPEQQQYFLEVQGRINEKLLSANLQQQY